MNKLYQLLKKIEKTPGLYLGTPTMCGLNHFINGYAFGCAENVGDCHDEEFDIFEGFQEYIEDKYQGRKTTAHWSQILIKFYGDEGAFKQFFMELDSFLGRDHAGNGSNGS